ncbi:siphovirus ReqiPepy6 Gp37-like family protein [Paenibacillus massiliensis]|uniref:siphovirus ReqiPepy6 Gp37-like family protein n=1 Tax=Paenibacillus massiliensis TaxID=225917 RepID=UPI0006847BDA|nr:siphovirus ReqiPepy6 Gp37-like family protein [Paenibacillus massiliensis]
MDTAFNLLGEIDDYESLQFTRRFFRAGEFELHIALGKQHTDKLVKDNIILIGNQPHKAGIIESRQITLEDGVETLTITGPDLCGILARRITVTDSYDRVRGRGETVIKHYVKNHLIEGTYPERRVPFLVLAPDALRGANTVRSSRFEPLSDVLQDIAQWCNMGYGIKLDFATKKWVFDVYMGRNLTVNQTTLPPVIFSHEFDNIHSQQFVDSDTNYRNVGYAGGKGEEEDRLMQTLGSTSGFDRREVFLDCSTAADIIELIQMGQRQLGELKRVQTLEGTVLDTGSFRYEQDWDLGDIVTVQNRAWGLTMDSRITEVKEIYEPASALEIIFGNDLPTIGQAIRKLTQQAKRSD